ncbi:hypothetical protein ZWY2020_034114 [Hordeum vulgare]|nr:hypothetical protein ZWY2020_034114 [Hordeum vulgare]
MFPYKNYINLGKVEYELWRYVPVASPGQRRVHRLRPLPFSSSRRSPPATPCPTFDCVARQRPSSKLFSRTRTWRPCRSTPPASRTSPASSPASGVVFTALVGMAAEDKAKVIAHLGAHMATAARRDAPAVRVGSSTRSSTPRTSVEAGLRCWPCVGSIAPVRRI